jgi:hypothetical protein
MSFPLLYAAISVSMECAPKTVSINELELLIYPMLISRRKEMLVKIIFVNRKNFENSQGYA